MGDMLEQDDQNENPVTKVVLSLWQGLTTFERFWKNRDSEERLETEPEPTEAD